MVDGNRGQRSVVRGLLCLVLLMAAPGWAEEALPAAGSMLDWSEAETLIGFRRVEEIFPTVPVARGERVHELRAAALPLQPEWVWQGRRWTVDEYMQAHRVTGLLVLAGDEILLQRHAFDRAADDRWVSFSVAKSLTSTLAGAAIADGHIEGLDAALTDTVPELRGTAYDDVTVRQLLTMTSGVAWNEDYTDPEADVAQIFAEPMVDGQSPILSYLGRLPRAHAPGEQFTYNTGETELVGILVARAVGRGLADYLSARIWAPLGMERDALWQIHEDGQETGGCCLNFTLRDQGRLARFILADGVIDGERVLPEGWLQEASAPQVDFGNGQGYGFQWWTRDGTFSARGIFGQKIMIDPELDLTVVVNAAWPHAVDADLREARWAFIEAVRDAVRDRQE